MASNLTDTNEDLSAEDMIVEDLESQRDRSPLRKAASNMSGGPERGGGGGAGGGLGGTGSSTGSGKSRSGGHKVAGPPPNGGGSGSSAQQLATQQAVLSAQQTMNKFEAPRAKKKRLLWQKGKLIGSGGFGKVFLGLDGNSGTLVAGKEFCFDGGNIDQKLKDLESEMKLMQKLNHKNIVKYYGADKRESLFYIFMEYVPGGSLRSILDQFGPLQDRVASRFAKQILTGLGYLHSNQVIHRDIKCANVLVNVDGVVKLADFGSAQFFTEAQGTHGTPFWMPPEVIRGEAVGWQCDIWSLGCSLIEMLTGETPFKEVGPNMKILYYIAGSDPIIVSEKIVQPYVRDFIFQCLQRDPAKRPSVKTLLDHEFIAMYSRRLGTGDSQILNSSNSSYMQAAQRSVVSSMEIGGGSSVTSSHHYGNSNYHNGSGSSRNNTSNHNNNNNHHHHGHNSSNLSPQQKDMELESCGSLDALQAGIGGGLNPLDRNNANNTNLCREDLDALGSTGIGGGSSAAPSEIGDLNVKDLEEDELDDNVKSALVNRAMSFATLGTARSSTTKTTNTNNVTGGSTDSTGRKLQQQQQYQGNLFTMININDPTMSVAESNFTTTVGGAGGASHGDYNNNNSSSVLNMMSNVIEVNKNDVIEIELDEEIGGPPQQIVAYKNTNTNSTRGGDGDGSSNTKGETTAMCGRGGRGGGGGTQGDDADEEVAKNSIGGPRGSRRGGGGGPRRRNSGGEGGSSDDEYSDSDRQRTRSRERSSRRCTTMQLLQLTVTILLIGVIGALAALLALKE